jgi:hypothetical protein
MVQAELAHGVGSANRQVLETCWFRIICPGSSTADLQHVNLEWNDDFGFANGRRIRPSGGGEPGSAFGASLRIGSAEACRPQVERIDFAQIFTIGQGINPAGATSMRIGTCGQQHRIFDGDDEVVARDDPREGDESD